MDDIEKMVFIEILDTMFKEEIVSFQDFFIKCSCVISEPTLRVYLSKKRLPKLNKYLILREKVYREYKLEMETAEFYLLLNKNCDDIEEYKKKLYFDKFGIMIS